ncbi:hypothetical protein AX774_g340 [Zancudomyces culisetae]|uniref:Uncharacterized protein n=1 Tax=Zancudomyces culisetae TaxID=1213189 RepID=A0A1R1PYS8_ZANCU|nr:hypothetical protein AX774_g340 [Zancudomyces culisetae]|eukprot:OMH86110.1 hypothetical protein AX774_g340 [Zancudomyces culisetae]
MLPFSPTLSIVLPLFSVRFCSTSYSITLASSVAGLRPVHKKLSFAFPFSPLSLASFSILRKPIILFLKLPPNIVSGLAAFFLFAFCLLPLVFPQPVFQLIFFSKQIVFSKFLFP